MEIMDESESGSENGNGFGEEGFVSPSFDIESDVMENQDEQETEVGLSISNVRSAIARYVNRVRSDLVNARREGMLPSHAAFGVVRQARQGNTDAQDKIRTVMKLAESTYPHAEAAKQAQENLARAAALQDAGVDESEAYESEEEQSAALDDEIQDFEMSGNVKVGLGLLPLIGGAAAAILAYFLVSASKASAADLPDKPKIPVSKDLAKSGPVSSWEGKRLKDLPEDVRSKLELAMHQLVWRRNPATGEEMPSWEAMANAKFVLLVPTGARDPKGWIYVRRDNKQRAIDWGGAADKGSVPSEGLSAGYGTAWKVAWHGDDMMVMAPVVVQPPGGIMSVVPDWAKGIIGRAASIASGGVVQASDIKSV